jgi:hypothetical protein
MTYAIEMGSRAMIYSHTKFHKDWFRLSKVDRGRDTQTHREHDELISQQIRFQNKESGLKFRNMAAV